MNKFTKALFGVAVAATMLFSLPSQEAKAINVNLTPPSNEFYYHRDTLAVSDPWEYIAPSVADPLLLSQDTAGENLAVSYLQFDTSGTIFADPSVKALGQLSLQLADVVPFPNLTGGTLSVYRASDSEVFGAGADIPNTGAGQISPISIGDLLGVINVTDLDDNDNVVINFTKQVQSSIVGATPYLSFALIADLSDATSIKEFQLAGTQSLLVTPAPEPMSLSYILLGSLAFAFRRVKALLGLA